MFGDDLGMRPRKDMMCFHDILHLHWSNWIVEAYISVFIIAGMLVDTT